MEDDLKYFTRRHLHHADKAETCDEPSARHAHRRLADLHRREARAALEARVEAPGVRLKHHDQAAVPARENSSYDD